MKHTKQYDTKNRVLTIRLSQPMHPQPCALLAPTPPAPVRSNNNPHHRELAMLVRNWH